MTPDFLIYQDYIHNNGQLHRALSPYGTTGYCDAADIISGVLDHPPRLLVMPGGADLYYCEKLNGAGNAAIRRYVEHGGSYLGICAGAYYACESLCWAAGTDQSITGSRELGFYPGTATGPVAALMQGLDQSWLGVAPLQCHDGSRMMSCYDAGPVFSEPGDQAEIMARYDSLPGQPPAIVGCAIGRGYAVLSGPHIERLMPWAANALSQHANPHYTYESGIYKTLASGATDQEKLWSLVMDRLLTQARAMHHAA